MFVKLLILSVCATAALGHLCLISPHQRGSMSGLNKPASDDCILLKAPCGGRPAASAPVLYKGSSNITLIFQKNLDHYISTSPGYYSVSFGEYDDQSTFKEVARIADKGEPSLHLYSVNVTLPAESPRPHHTLQVSYITKNDKAPAAFYQCADMFIY